MARELSRSRKMALYILSSPILVFGLLFDIIKLPFVILFFAPLWGFLDLLDVCRGDKSTILPDLACLSCMGISIWMDTVGITQPKWM